MPPWEKYQQQGGKPWERYSPSQHTSSTDPQKQNFRDLFWQAVTGLSPQTMATPEEISDAIEKGIAPGTFPGGVLRGLRDIPDQGAQLLTRGLEAGAGAVGAGEDFMRGEREKVEAINRAAEAEYQSGRDPESFDYGRLVGNVAGTVPLAAAVPGAASASLAARIPAAAVGGAITGVMQPVPEDEDFWEAKAKQSATGAALAGATTGVIGGVARIGRLTRGGKAASEISREGVRPTIGQRAGGIIRTAEEKAKSVPVLGQAIQSAEGRAVASFNKAVGNRALRHIGEKVDDGIDAGYGLVSHVHQKASAAYRRAIPDADSKIDMVFRRDMARLADLVDEMPSADAKQSFSKILQNRLWNRVSKSDVLTGESAKSAISDLGEEAAKYGRSSDSVQRSLGDALREAQATIKRMVARQHPEAARDIAKADKTWAEFLRLQRAATYVGADEGVFTPAQYRNAVSAMDRSYRKGAVAEGRAVGQSFADTARTALRMNVPNSGTTDRALMTAWPTSIGAALLSQNYPLAAYLAAGPPLAAGAYWGVNRAVPALAGTGRYLAPTTAVGAGPLTRVLAGD